MHQLIIIFISLAGKYSNATGAFSPITCKDCPVGTFANGGGFMNCALCPAGFYSNTTAATMCSPCPLGSYSAVTGAISSSTCLLCSPGYYASNLASVSCVPCANGTFSLSGESKCSSCPTGKYSYSNISPACSAISCSSTGYSGVSGNCTCGQGYGGAVVYVSGSLSGCEACKSGEWSIGGNGVSCLPIPCPNNGYAGAPGSCECAPGFTGRAFYISEIVRGCTACPNNMWSPGGNGDTFSNACVGISCGYSGYAGRDGMCMCAAGFYGNVEYISGLASGCIPCASNKWSVAGTNKTCQYISCLKTGYTGAAGNCTCSAGYYGSSLTYFSGSPSGCSPCGKGYFTSSTGSISCSSCPLGSYAPSLGMEACLLCPEGSYSDAFGLISCIACPQGEFPYYHSKCELSSSLISPNSYLH